MKIKRIIVGGLALVAVLSILTACNNKETGELSDEKVSLSGEENNREKKIVENNGSSFVLYKENVYFREYTNADIEKTAVDGSFDFNKEERHSKYINVILPNGRIENVFKDEGLGDFYILDDRFFFNGYQNKLYSVDMNGENYIEFCKGSYIGCKEAEHLIYYKNTNNDDALYSLDTRNLKITKITDANLNEESIKKMCDPEPEPQRIELSSLFTEAELQAFGAKYNVDLEDTNYSVNIRECEKVGNKFYVLIDLLKLNTKDSSSTKKVYDRVASEEYSYDLTTGKKVLIYLYKVTDKEEVESGDIYSSGENIAEEPLAENEMYLEIQLRDKGLKETFDIRVEEVGGLIIGKRIEYEGTHSRNEGVLRLKVTKELGAMLSVYIDDVLDSQMLIEE